MPNEVAMSKNLLHICTREQKNIFWKRIKNIKTAFKSGKKNRESLEINGSMPFKIRSFLKS